IPKKHEGGQGSAVRRAVIPHIGGSRTVHHKIPPAGKHLLARRPGRCGLLYRKGKRAGLLWYPSTVRRASSRCRAPVISLAKDALPASLCTSPRPPPCQTRSLEGLRRRPWSVCFTRSRLSRKCSWHSCSPATFSSRRISSISCSIQAKNGWLGSLLLLANFGKEGKLEPVIPRISQETLAARVGTTRSRINSS